MTTYNYGIDYPFSASGDLSAKQYYFMTTACTAERVLTATGASNPAPIGILQNDPVSGDEAAVRVMGVSKLVVDADTAIVYGDYLTSGSGGMGVQSAGSSVAAVALQGLTSGTGIKIKVLLLPYGSGNKADNTP